MDVLRRKEAEEDLQKMHKRHLTLSMALQTKAAEKLKDLKGKDMKVKEAIKAITEGAKLERLTRGQPTEQLKGEVTATIQGPAPMPWEAMPQAKEGIQLVVDKLRKERAAEKDESAA